MHARARKKDREHQYVDADKVTGEIAYMESRLDEIGHDGDCAYEKALIRFFEQQLRLRRNWLKSQPVAESC